MGQYPQIRWRRRHRLGGVARYLPTEAVVDADANIYAIEGDTIASYDSTGAYRWTENGSDWTELLTVDEDGNLSVIDIDGGAEKYDTDTGDSEWWNPSRIDGDPEGLVPDGEGVVATAQDVANVVRCLDVLRPTTHEIDQRKRAVVDAINVKREGDDVEGLEPIIDYLEESDASQVNLPELENIIDDLEANYLISVDGDTYTANNWDALGEPNIDEHGRFFADAEDPLSGESFLDWWESRRDEVEARGDDLFTDPELQSSSDSLGTDVGVKYSIVDFDVDAEPWVADILSQIQSALDGTRVPDMSKLTFEGFIGLVGPDTSSMSNVSTAGSMLDPSHEVWNVDDKADTWVTTETDLVDTSSRPSSS